MFLLATLGVYLGVAELRDQMYGRCLISMVTAMLAAYICFLIPADDFSDPSCYIKGECIFASVQCPLGYCDFFDL